MKWRIGSIQLEGKKVLAPMMKITDLPFRLLCRNLGADLAYTEMVNCNAVSRGNVSARQLFTSHPLDSPLGIQLYGSNPEKFLATAKIIRSTLPEKKFFIDLNFSCPDRNVIKQGAGVALLKRPKRMNDIIKMLVDNEFIVTVKIRKFSHSYKKIVSLINNFEKIGISAVTIHARTIIQKNAGNCDWKLIKQIKSNCNIPVIGNGDINSVKDFQDMLQFTECDAGMIGKRAMYLPGIFTLLQKSLPQHTFSKQERIKWLKIYFNHATSTNTLKKGRLDQRIYDIVPESKNHEVKKKIMKILEDNINSN